MGRSFSLILPVLLVLFGVYGFFFPHYPVVNADELWETSRAYHLLTHHQPGEPILPKEVSPFYASVENLPWQGWFLGTLKQSSFALMMMFMPGKEWLAMRLTMFLWTALLCYLTYLFARRLHLSRQFALLSVTLLAFFPDLFIQVHRERSEILIAISLLAAVMLMVKAMEEESEKRKRRYYLILGLLSWVPSFLIHPSAIIIPPVVGFLFLIRERSNLFSRDSLLIGIGLMAGAFFFLYLMDAVRSYAELAGGGNYFKYQGPPILLKGWKYVIAIPVAFYFKFMAFNPISRPFSFFIFITGFILLIVSRHRFPDWLSRYRYLALMIATFLSLLLLYLLSGSFGNYNIVVLPFIAIVIAGFLERLRAEKKLLSAVAAITIVLMSFCADVWSIPESSAAAGEYKKLLSKVDSLIPQKAEGIMGVALYYMPFRERRFYSVSWFNRDAGIDGQSFEDAVDKLKVSHLIVDDAFIGRAVLDRGHGWTDSLIHFLSNRCDTVAVLQTELRAGNRVPEKNKFPRQWMYTDFRKGFIRKVAIFHVRDKI